MKNSTTGIAEATPGSVPLRTSDGACCGLVPTSWRLGRCVVVGGRLMVFYGKKMGTGVNTNARYTRNPWRGSLLPLGCEAAPIISVFKPKNRDCYAVQREQAPSPQKHSVHLKSPSTHCLGQDSIVAAWLPPCSAIFESFSSVAFSSLRVASSNPITSSSRFKCLAMAIKVP